MSDRNASYNSTSLDAAIEHVEWAMKAFEPSGERDVPILREHLQTLITAASDKTLYLEFERDALEKISALKGDLSVCQLQLEAKYISITSERERELERENERLRTELTAVKNIIGAAQDVRAGLDEVNALLNQTSKSGGVE